MSETSIAVSTATDVLTETIPITVDNSNTTLYRTQEETTPSQILLFFSVAIAVAIIAKIITTITRYHIEKAAAKAKKKEADELSLEEQRPAFKLPTNKKLSTAGGGLFNMLSLAAVPGSPEIGKKMWEEGMSFENQNTNVETKANSCDTEKAQELPGSSASTSKNVGGQVILVQPRVKAQLTIENEAVTRSNLTGEEICLVQPKPRQSKTS